MNNFPRIYYNENHKIECLEKDIEELQNKLKRRNVQVADLKNRIKKLKQDLYERYERKNE